jgi:hypothetical protein
MSAQALRADFLVSGGRVLVLRHTAFFLHRDTTTADDRFEMLKGLVFLRSECAGPVAGDYGEDLFGGSRRLREIKPHQRTPKWRGRTEGPPSEFDVALHLDFEDQAGLDAYNEDDVHHRIGAFNASINEPELTARVDWWYDGPPLTRPGKIRHTAMFVWTDESDDAQRKAALEAVRRFEDAPGIISVNTGENVGPLTTDYDWIYDVQLEDVEAARSLLDSELYRGILQAIGPTTKYEWTAQLTHRMRGP